jgi:hypothetical protein
MHLALGALAALLTLAFVGSFHWELTDPFVGPAIRSEAGPGYVNQAYLTMAVCALLHVLGVVTRRASRRTPSQSRGSG